MELLWVRTGKRKDCFSKISSKGGGKSRRCIIRQSNIKVIEIDNQGRINLSMKDLGESKPKEKRRKNRKLVEKKLQN